MEHIIGELGEWQGADPKTGFQLVKTVDGRILKIADLVDDASGKQARIQESLPLPVIEEAIEKIKDDSIGNFQYDTKTVQIVG